MANFPRSFLHDSFLVSFLRFSRGRRSSSFSSSFPPFRFLFLSSRCQNFQLLGLVALLLLFPSTAELPKRSSPSLRFKEWHRSFVSETRALRNSRTRRYRGTTFRGEPLGWCSISNWIKLSLFPLSRRGLRRDDLLCERKQKFNSHTLFSTNTACSSRAWSCFSARVVRKLSLSLSLSLSEESRQKAVLFSIKTLSHDSFETTLVFALLSREREKEREKERERETKRELA